VRSKQADDFCASWFLPARPKFALDYNIRLDLSGDQGGFGPLRS